MENDLRSNLTGHTDATRADGRLSQRRLGLSGVRGALSAPAARGGALLTLAVSLVAALSSLAPGMALAHAAGRSATTPSSAPLLPGEKLWNGAPSYLFGANDAYDWAGSYGFDQKTSIQSAVKSAGLPIARVWFFQYDETTGAPVSDAQQEAIYTAAISHTGATCFANLYTTNSVAYDLHIVSMFKGRCEMYEVMNEPDSDSSVTPQSYLDFWNSFVSQARKIDPNALFGGPATTVPLGYDCTWPSPGVQQCFLEKWLQGTVASGVRPDFVTFHWYTCWNEDATACMQRAPVISTIGDSTIAMVNKYYPGQNIPVGMTEWNSNAGNPSYQFDDTWMSQYEQASLTGLEQSHLSFAMQFDLASCAGWGSLDMFNVCAGPSDGSPRPYEGVWAREIAREVNGGVSSGSGTVTPPASSGSSSGSSGGSSTGSATGTSTPAPTNTPTTSSASTPTSAPTTTPGGGTSASGAQPSAAALFSDDFQSATIGAAPPSWTAENGSWTVQQDGVLSSGLPNYALAQGNPSTASEYTISAGSSAWTNYTVQASVKPGANDLNQTTDIMARFTDDNDHYSFLLKNNSEWYLGKRAGGSWTTLAQGTFAYSSQFYKLALTVNGATISGAINGKVVATVTDTSFANGKVAFLTSAESELDNVVVAEPGSASLTAAPGGSSGSSAPAASGVDCVEVINGQLTSGKCGGKFTPLLSSLLGSSSDGPLCVEQQNGSLAIGRCSGPFTVKP